MWRLSASRRPGDVRRPVRISLAAFIRLSSRSQEVWRSEGTGVPRKAGMNHLLLFSQLRENRSGVAAGAVRRVAHVERVMPEPREFLLDKLQVIERIVASICRRSGMDADATEDFAAEVRLRLVENDYAVIKAYKNRSTFEVYIAAVVKRMLLDHRNHEWGKWRVSAEAKRLGPLAIALERLLYRDWRSVADAIVLLTAQHGNVSGTEIERLALRIPVRVRRKTVGVEHAAGMAASATELDPVRNETARRVSELVGKFIDRLGEEDQLILKLHFDSVMTVAQIARALNIEQALLYRRLYRQFDLLRAQLTQAGISAGDVEDLIGKDIVALDFHLKNCGSRPSGKDDESDEGDESVLAARREEIP